MPGPDSLSGPAMSSSPEHLGEDCQRHERVERSIAAPSALSGVANRIGGTTLRRKLDSRWRRESCRSGGPTCPCGRVCSAAWRAARWGLSLVWRLHRAARRACARSAVLRPRRRVLRLVYQSGSRNRGASRGECLTEKKIRQFGGLASGSLAAVSHKSVTTRVHEGAHDSNCRH